MKAIDQHLAEARAKLDRVTAEDLQPALDAGAILFDIRPIEQRREDGEFSGAIIVQRNVLEWRLSPSSDAQEFGLDQDSWVIIMCNQGYQSSLAAATLQEVGLPKATDLVGGYQAVISGPYDPNG